MVVNGSLHGGKFLQASHAPKPRHPSFSSSKRSMRTLHPVVEVSPFPLLRLMPDVHHRGAKGGQPIRDDGLWIAVLPEAIDPEPNVHHQGKLDDLGRALERAEGDRVIGETVGRGDPSSS